MKARITMVDMIGDPDRVQAGETRKIAAQSPQKDPLNGKSKEEIDELFLPKEDGALFMGITGKGLWATFRKIGEDAYSIPDEQDKFWRRKRQNMEPFIDLDFTDGPNGAQLVIGWKRRFT